MLIAIASTRGPKVEAAKAFLPKVQQYLTQDPSIEYHLYDIDGGIVMPRTVQQLMTGAYERVVRLQKRLEEERKTASYIIGMEGGFHAVEFTGRRNVFLQSWAYVSNGKEGYFGSSGNVLVPEKIAHEVMGRGRDLGEVIDEFTRRTDIRSNQGTWGVLTRDLLARQQSFEIALIAAFAPFYNKSLYQGEP